MAPQLREKESKSPGAQLEKRLDRRETGEGQHEVKPSTGHSRGSAGAPSVPGGQAKPQTTRWRGCALGLEAPAAPLLRKPWSLKPGRPWTGVERFKLDVRFNDRVRLDTYRSA